VIEEINRILQIASATLLLLTCVHLIRNWRAGRHIWVAVGFTLSIVAYLVVEEPFVAEFMLAKMVVMVLTISVSVFFWLMSKSIFDDHFKPDPSIIGWFLLQLVPTLLIIRFKDYLAVEQGGVIRIVPQVIALGFLFAGLYTALRTKRGDLIDSRLRFRTSFIAVTAGLIGLTLIVEVAMFGRQSPIILQALQRLSILGLTGFFLLRNFDIQPGFFFQDVPKTKPVIQEDPILQEKLLSLIEGKQAYKKEGLTIGQLAELMGEQEYRVRRVINTQLGYKNFNDFLNHYRIAEACRILTDPGQARKTILEIGYELGYQSIGPFNKAFREQTGNTPTAYRKANLKT
jgi:AraC-like DNA-binding protein